MVSSRRRWRVFPSFSMDVVLIFTVAEVSLEDIKEGKRAKIQIGVPGDTLIIERVADTFENAVTGCVDAMKEKLTRTKEKKYDK